MGNNWRLGQVTVSAVNDYFDFIFEATKTKGNLGNIGVDDIDFVKGGSCEFLNSTTTQSTTTQLLPDSTLECNFENNFCDWYAMPGSTMWTRQNSLNVKYGTAPLNDVTYQNSLGYYAIVFSNSTVPLDDAILRSPPATADTDYCFDFWYQLGGPINSGMSVNLRDKTAKSTLWSRKGNQADTWSHAYVTIPKQDRARWLEIEADLSAAFYGFVAVDDIRVLLSACPPAKFCDFESNDLCIYENDVQAKIAWTRIKGKAPNSGLATGPEFDHTYQTGKI